MRFQGLSFALLAPFFVGCLGAVQGSGNVVEDDRTVARFSEVEVAGDFDVDIVIGDQQKVVLRFDDNLVDLVKTETVDGRLIVQQHQDISFYDTTEKSIRIDVPSLRAFVASGDTSATIRGINGSRFDTVVSGSARLTLDGSVSALDVSASGATRLDASTLEAKDTSIAASGDSELRVFASQSITGSLSGDTKLSVYGDPELQRVTVSGEATVDYR